MNRTAAVAASAVAAMLWGAGAAIAVPATGGKAPALNLPTIKGPRFRLQAALGKQPILLNFFTTW